MTTATAERPMSSTLDISPLTQPHRCLMAEIVAHQDAAQIDTKQGKGHTRVAQQLLQNARRHLALPAPPDGIRADERKCRAMLEAILSEARNQIGRRSGRELTDEATQLLQKLEDLLFTAEE